MPTPIEARPRRTWLRRFTGSRSAPCNLSGRRARFSSKWHVHMFPATPFLPNFRIDGHPDAIRKPVSRQLVIRHFRHEWSASQILPGNSAMRKKGPDFEFRRCCEICCLYPSCPVRTMLFAINAALRERSASQILPDNSATRKKGPDFKFRRSCEICCLYPSCPVRIILFEINAALR